MRRKARALIGLNRFEEARQAAVDGLQYEPNDKVCDISLSCKLLCTQLRRSCLSARWDQRKSIDQVIVLIEQDLNAVLKEMDQKLGAQA